MKMRQAFTMEPADGSRIMLAGGIPIQAAVIHPMAGSRSMEHGTTLIHPVIVRLAGEE